MDFLSTQFIFALLSIILLDLVLAGDNAIVIAMASRRLPETLRKKAIYLGTAGAVVIRALMTLLATYILTVPFLQAIGGLILLPIAIKLLKPSESDLESNSKLSASANFITAIKTIIIADAAMGIDNVLAVAGAAHGNILLVILGLLISIPIVVCGSQVVAKLMDKVPILITIGSCILAYTSATMILHDKIIGNYLISISSYMTYFLPTLFILSIIIYSFKVTTKIPTRQ